MFLIVSSWTQLYISGVNFNAAIISIVFFYVCLLMFVPYVLKFLSRRILIFVQADFHYFQLCPLSFLKSVISSTKSE